MQLRTLIKIAGALALVAAVSPVFAAPIFSDNFSTFQNGNLVGQNGYTQYATTNQTTGVVTSSSTNPIQVTNGVVTVPGIAASGTGGATNDGQDVFKAFITPVNSGSAYVGLSLTVSSAGTTSSYIAGFVDNSTTSNFVNGRIAPRANGDGTYSLGVRVTGQGGAPFVYGGSLNFNQTYSVVERFNFVTGPNNDTVDLFVNTPSENGATPYATGVVNLAAGTETDPTQLGAYDFSQFANSTTAQAGYKIGTAKAATTYSEAFVPASASVVPEANTALLALVGVLPLALVAVRRRKAA